MISLPLLLALLAGVCNVLVGVLGKQIERAGCRPAAMPVFFLGTVALVAAAALPFVHGNWGDHGLWALALAMGLLYVMALLTMIGANQVCPPSLVWSLVNLALVVPIVLAPVLLHEAWRAVDGLLVTAFIATVWLMQRGMGNTGEVARAHGMRVWLLLSGVFISNGLLMLGFNLKAQYWPQVGAVPFTVLVFGSGAVLGLLIGNHARRPWATDVEWQWGSAMGVAAAAANLCLLGAVVLPAVVAFPLIQGTALIGGVLLMVALFGERLNADKIGGLCCGGLVLALAMLR